MKQLSKTSEEYFQNSGWSSNLFIEHAKVIYHHFKNEIKIGRTVVHIKNQKLYVHHSGRSKEYMTICDSSGNEQYTFHYSESPNLILEKLIQLIS